MENDDDDYVSDSNSSSILSGVSDDDHDMHSDNNDDDDESSNDNFDDTVPDLKASPPKWTEDIQGFDLPHFRLQSGPSLPDDFSDNSHPADYFKLFFTEDLVQSFVDYTNKYAAIQINKKRITIPNYIDKEWSLDGSNNVTKQEMWAYLGSCVILSINPFRQLRHVFSADPYMNNAGIREIFTLRRFTKISNYLCVSDKENEPERDSSQYDKLFKIRPVVQKLNDLFPKYYKHSAHQVIDETSIKMASRDSVRQFCPQKPGARFAWKVWSRCDSESPQKPYLLQFIPYLGKKHTKVSKHGLYFDVVNALTKSLRGTNVRLYTDNAYSSLKLFKFLRKYSVFCIGMAHGNSIGLHPYVKNPPKKAPRGFHKIFQDENDRNVTCAVWFDTKAV